MFLRTLFSLVNQPHGKSREHKRLMKRKRDERSRVKITGSSTFFKPHNKICVVSSVRTNLCSQACHDHTRTKGFHSAQTLTLRRKVHSSTAEQPHDDHKFGCVRLRLVPRSFGTDARPQPRSDHRGASLKMKAAAQTTKTNHWINSVALTAMLGL